MYSYWIHTAQLQTGPESSIVIICIKYSTSKHPMTLLAYNDIFIDVQYWVLWFLSWEVVLNRNEMAMHCDTLEKN